MLNTYIGDCENCKGNCRECDSRPVTMEFRSVENHYLSAEDLIEVLEMFPEKELFFDSQPNIKLTISDDYINITPIKPYAPYGEFQF